MNETPETDNFIMKRTALSMDCNVAVFMRELEIQRDEARKEIKRLEKINEAFRLNAALKGQE
jgi:hypothetical protein